MTNTPSDKQTDNQPPAKWDQCGLKEACQRALKLGRTHQEMDIQLVLDMLLEIERLEAEVSNGQPVLATR